MCDTSGADSTDVLCTAKRENVTCYVLIVYGCSLCYSYIHAVIDDRQLVPQWHAWAVVTGIPPMDLIYVLHTNGFFYKQA